MSKRKRPTTITLSDNELASVLCALRLWQRGEIACHCCEEADHFEDADPLTADEVDELCIRINGGDER